MSTGAAGHPSRPPKLIAPSEASPVSAGPVVKRRKANPGSGSARQSILAKVEPRRAASTVEVASAAGLAEELASVRAVLDLTLNNVEQGILMIDAEHRVRLYNRKFAELLELPKRMLTDPLHFRQILEYQLGTGEFSGVSEDIASWIRSGGVFKSPPVYERRRPNGTILEIRTVLLDDGGAVRTFTDITDRVKREEALQRAEAEYRGLFENAVVGIYRSHLEGRVVRANPALVQLNGYASEAEMLAEVNDIARQWYVDPKRRDEFLNEMRTKGKVTDFISEVYRYKTREKIWVSETAWCVRGESGAPDTFEGTVLDASARMHSEAKIAHMAHHDALTGLPNRADLTQRIERALAEIPRRGSFAVHYLDLDRFKEVNDTLGHAAGDALLRLAGRRLKRCVRAQDVVARLGGDEFAVIQFGIKDDTEIGELGARIVRSLSAPYRLAGHHADVGVSVGMALAPDDGADVQSLIKNADIALYQAKADGRNVHRRFDSEIEASLQERRKIEIDLRGALARDEFIVEFQPIISFATGETEGYEALIRWQHPTRGRIAPSLFIPLAEEIGIIEPIGEWVLRRACSEVARLSGRPFVSVNLSPFQFRSRNIVKTIMNAVAGSGLDADRLVLEITETVLLRDDSFTKDALAELRQLGVEIALDDFGTGHSSLHYLQKFRFDKIKIDRSFVASFDKDRTNGAVVRAVVNLGRELDIEVIAEGIETQEQFVSLAALGCHSAQGYLMGRPQALAAFAPKRGVGFRPRSGHRGASSNQVAEAKSRAGRQLGAS